jgi:Transposase IS116/IS110/IS902 family
MGNHSDGLIMSHATQEHLRDALAASTELNSVYRRLLKMMLEELRLIEEQIGQLDQEMADFPPYQDQVQRLAEVPGLGVDSAQQIIAEVGATAATLPSAKQLSSWVGACPGDNESAGVNYSHRSLKGRSCIAARYRACASADRPRRPELPNWFPLRRAPSLCAVHWRPADRKRGSTTGYVLLPLLEIGPKAEGQLACHQPLHQTLGVGEILLAPLWPAVRLRLAAFPNSSAVSERLGPNLRLDLTSELTSGSQNAYYLLQRLSA